MNTQRTDSCSSSRQALTSRQWWAMPAAFLATILALPGHAADDFAIPSAPMTVATRQAANLMFIMDDTGTMGLIAMPKNIMEINDSAPGGGNRQKDQDGLFDNPTDRSYIHNTIYYDPSIDYLPWVKADGTRMPNASIDKAAVNLDFANGTTTGTPGSCDTVDPNDMAWCDLRGTVRSAFYVPNTSWTTGSTNAAHYDRYHSRTIGGVAKVGIGSGNTVSLGAWNDQDINAGNWYRQTITVPAGAGPLTIVVQNGSGGNAELYLRLGSAPTITANDYAATGAGNAHTINVPSPTAGIWHIGVYNAHGSTKVNDEDVSASYLNFVEKTPLREDGTRRTQAAELQNYANWFTYYRTRIKTAKGGASEAFKSVGRGFRVGYTSINNNAQVNGIALWAGGTPSISHPIPVTKGNGEYYDDAATSITNKTNFYSHLQGALSGRGTPMRESLMAVGKYYKTASNSGTKGPWWSASDQKDISCRQSFAILASDGYWSTGTGDWPEPAVGNADGGAGAPYAGAGSDTLADVAFYYWKNDLRTEASMPNNVPTSNDDPATHQHMTTFMVSIGARGQLDPVTDWAGLQAGTTQWPQPVASTSNDIKKIDDMWHAAVNGHGDFVVANNPQEFANALSSALASIERRNSSFSNAATSSTSLEEGSLAFDASYMSGDWSGELRASELSEAGVGSVKWKASEKMPAWGSRKIFTSQAGTGEVFPSSSQNTSLVRTGQYAVTAVENANYIKGDHNKEIQNGGELRNRIGTVLGDIVNSSPAYVKDTKTVYVGANDGMLHAFDATTGVEQFAYVPSIIDIPGLATLSRNDYGSTGFSHRYFVDGPVTVSSRNVTKDVNLLVGTLGRGGKGLFALDVTNPRPSDSTAAKAMYRWELAETTGNNMGLILSKPIIANVPGGTGVIFGNGINSTNHRAVLIVQMLAPGNTLGTTVEIPAGDAGVDGDATNPNGLTAPTAVYGKDGKTVAYVYAGDMLGNVWKFNLVTKKATKLFAAGNSQPITGGVTSAVDPLTSKRWVLFGTGQFLIDADKTSTKVQSLYGIIDEDNEVPKSSLTQRNVSASGTDASGKAVRSFDAKASLPTASKGWYIDLPAGERVIQPAQMASTFMLTASMSPATDSIDPCQPAGSGFINALDAFTGTSAGGSYFDLPNSDDKFNGNPIGSVDINTGMPTLPALLRGLILAGGTGESAGIKSIKSLSPRWDRMSWREVRID